MTSGHEVQREAHEAHEAHERALILEHRVIAICSTLEMRKKTT